MTRTRVASALVLLPIVAIFVQVGGWWFFGGMTVIALLATWEFVQMMRQRGYAPHALLAFAFALASLVSMQLGRPEWLLPALSGLLMVSLVWQLFQAQSTAPVVDWALTVAGGGYIGLGMAHLLGLRLLPQGYAWVWLALLGTWGCDTFAYFVGRAVGRHKFWPRLSPKKTWEGVFAGVPGGMFGAWLATLFSGIPLSQALIIGVLIAIVAPLGDLSISMMKRYAGVKDSSHLIPGHGGMLDRVDSVLFVSITVFYYALWVVV